MRAALAADRLSPEGFGALLSSAAEPLLEELAAETADGGPALLVGVPLDQGGYPCNCVALLDSGQARCELPLGLAANEQDGREILLGIRPEQIALGASEGNGLPAIRAEVQVTEPTGPDLLVFVTLNQTKVCCRLAPDVAPQVGETQIGRAHV